MFSFWQQDLRIEKSMDSLIIFVVLLLQLIALSPLCNPMAPVRSTSCWYFGCCIPECFGCSYTPSGLRRFNCWRNLLSLWRHTPCTFLVRSEDNRGEHRPTTSRAAARPNSRLSTFCNHLTSDMMNQGERQSVASSMRFCHSSSLIAQTCHPRDLKKLSPIGW